MFLGLLYALIPGVAIGWILRGRLRYLSQLRLSWFWLVLLGLAIQVVAMGYVARNSIFVLTFRPAIIIGSYALVLLGLIRNARIPGMQFVAVGFALNFLAIAANGGGMPVTRETLEASGQGYLATSQQPGEYIWRSKDVLLPREQTRLWALTDILITPPPETRAASIGDFVTYLGVAVVIVTAMRKRVTPVQTALPEGAASAA